jgi:SAM-dependent methyltransferase
VLALRYFYNQFCSFFFDPRQIVNNWRGLPYFAVNGLRYGRLNRHPGFRIRLGDLLCCAHDRFEDAGTARGHYFWQDLWAARILFANQVREHVDVASRVDGFVAHVLPFCQVVYVDLRPLPSEVEGLEFRRGSLLSLPFADNSVASLSCLHVLEHIGLGRYTDPVDPEGHLKAAKELVRVLAPGGTLLLGTPVGQERLCFDAHRIFDPQTVLDAFSPLQLAGFSLIDDRGAGVLPGAPFDQARRCRYGCGLFILKKEPSI